MYSQETNNQIWPYLHGLLSAVETEAFESRLGSDLQLREQVTEARLLDATLKAASQLSRCMEELKQFLSKVGNTREDFTSLQRL